MSTSHLDWSSVGFHSHPIPGDPAAVQATASAFRETASRLSEAANGLRRLDSAETESLAVTKLLSNAREVAGLLELALDRYDVAADALAAYGPVQAQAKATAEAAVRDAMTARGLHDRAATNASNLRLGAMTTIDPQQRQDFLQAYHQAKAQAADASSSFESAKARVLGAISDRDRAADHAARQVSGAIANREINDDLFDQLGELWEGAQQFAADIVANNPLLKAVVDAAITAAKWVWDHIEQISLVLKVASILLGWVPFLGPALIILSRIADVVALIKAATTLAGSFAHGVQTGDFSGFLVGATLTVVTFGIGRGIGKVAKADLSGVSKRAFDRTVSGQGFTKAVASVGRSHHPVNKGLSFLTLADESGSIHRTTDSLIDTLKQGHQPYADLVRDKIVVDLATSEANDIIGIGAGMVEDALVPHHDRISEQGLQNLGGRP